MNDEEHPARRALREHVTSFDDRRVCHSCGAPWPCATYKLAQELLERYP